jgi:hypothetical protein
MQLKSCGDVLQVTKSGERISSMLSAGNNRIEGMKFMTVSLNDPITLLKRRQISEKEF